MLSMLEDVIDIIKRIMKRASVLAVLLFALSSLGGCTKMLIGEDAMDVNPIEDPAVNITSFTDALECMDEMLLHYNIPLIVLTAQDIPNMASEGSLAGTKDMLITSMSKMSERSGKVRFVSYGTDLKDILLVHRAHEMKDSFQAPDFFIRGSITQHDKGVVANRIGGALRHDDWNAALSAGHSLSYISLDLNVGLVSNLQMLPGMTSNNILAVTDRGFGMEYGGRIESAGLFFDFGVDRRDGLGQAIRNLVDLGAIEVVGKLAGVPYMSCMPIDFNAAPVVASIRKEYDLFAEKGNLVKAIQAKLKQYNYYNGEVDGRYDDKTRLAIEYYRRLYGIPRTGRTSAIDFALYKDVVYGDKYEWETDRLLGDPDVLSFDHETLVANKMLSPIKEDIQETVVNEEAIAWQVRKRGNKTPPVASNRALKPAPTGSARGETRVVRGVEGKPLRKIYRPAVVTESAPATARNNRSHLLKDDEIVMTRPIIVGTGNAPPTQKIGKQSLYNNLSGDRSSRYGEAIEAFYKPSASQTRELESNSSSRQPAATKKQQPKVYEAERNNQQGRQDPKVADANVKEGPSALDRLWDNLLQD